MGSNLLYGLFLFFTIFVSTSHQLSLSTIKDDEATTFKKLQIFFLQECECIKLTQCQRMTDIIARIKLPISPALNERIRRTSCNNQQDTEPIICCPREAKILKPEDVELVSFRFASSDNDDIDTDDTKYNDNHNPDWIWPKDDTGYPNSYNNHILDDHQSYKSFKFEKSNKFRPKNKYPFNPITSSHYDNNYENDLTMKNLIDFEDQKTHKNCPPSFYDDYTSSFDESKFSIPSSKDKFYFDKFYNGRRPTAVPTTKPQLTYNRYDHHFHHHNHPHPNHFDHQFDSENGYWHGYDDIQRFNPIRDFTMVPDKLQPPSKTPKTTTLEPKPNTFTPIITANNENSLPSVSSILINSQQCGISVGTRIIGGSASSPGQFPWMARIAYRNLSSGVISYRCAGSFINQLYLVTAAHCVTNLIDNLQVSHIRQGDDLDVISTQIEYKIEQLIPHANYDSPKYANDIALVRVIQPSNSIQIVPICLPAGEYNNVDNDIVGKIGVVAGWLSNARDTARTVDELEMNWVRLPIVNLTNCAKIYADFSLNSRTPIIVTNNQICAQGTENMDACQGDSGGPLMMENNDRRNPRSVLLGLVSFGPRTCGISNFPGVYTRISSYIDWITRNMRL